jgi:hypothetical protein
MIKDLIGPGIGFAPGGVKYLVTRGLDISQAVPVTPLVLPASAEDPVFAASYGSTLALIASHPMATVTYLDDSEPWFAGETRPLRFEMSAASPSIAGWTLHLRLARWQPRAVEFDRVDLLHFGGGATVVDIGAATLDGTDAFTATLDGADTEGLEPRLYWLEARRTDDGSNRLVAGVRWRMQGEVAA